MNRIEAQTFIGRMEELGDVWTMEEVMNCYGEESLEEALEDRGSLLMGFANILSMILNR